MHPMAHRAARSSGPPVVDEVQVTGLENVNPRLFDTLKEAHTGKPLDRPQLDKEVQALYGRGDFERISYRLTRQGGRERLIVDAVEKSWGPGYLSFGLGIYSDFEGDNRFNIRGSYRRTWLNRLGAEWTTDIAVGNDSGLFTEFYQPFNLERKGFVAPYLDIDRAPVSIYQGNDRIARYDVRRSKIGVDLGTTFSTGSELRVGAFLGNSQFEVDTGDLLLPEGSLNDSGVRVRFVHDTLDSAWFPRSGQRLKLDLTRPLSTFGADREYTRLEATWRGAWKFGKDSLTGSLRGGTSFDDQMPYYDQFDLGGFLRLSGYANEQFRGNQIAYANLVYQRQIATLTPPLGRALYLGGSLEYGRLWDVALNDPDSTTAPFLNPEKNRYGGSLFFGADTWLGPFYLGWGLSGEGDNTFYVLLGQP
jgi:NTE family protein